MIEALPPPALSPRVDNQRRMNYRSETFHMKGISDKAASKSLAAWNIA